MSSTACRWCTGNTERLLLVLLLVHALVQCAKAATASPVSPIHGGTDRRQNVDPNIAQAEQGDQGNGQTEQKEQGADNKAKEAKDQSPPNGQNKDSDKAKDKTATEVKETKNSNNATGNGGSKKTDANNTKAHDKDVELKNLTCSKTDDCGAYKDTACVQDPKDGAHRCLCGNRAPPRNTSLCKDIRRHVKFPCKETSQCIAEAECVLSRANDSKPDVAHSARTPTAFICWCKEGFNATPDNAHCLDKFGRLKMDQEGAMKKLETTISKLEKDQKSAEERIGKLEKKGSGVQILPSVTVTALLAISILAMN